MDSSYRDEVRIALVEDDEVIEFDHHIASEENIKGNIYLGTVERIEPSLQAVFVDYGKDKHGFLSFSDIHPGYAGEAALITQSDDAQTVNEQNDSDSEDSEIDNDATTECQNDHDEREEREVCDISEVLSDSATAMQVQSDDESEMQTDGQEQYDSSNEGAECDDQQQGISCIDESEDDNNGAGSNIIKIGQRVIVQVTKESRGTKGCMLTTYINLQGRYCALMPYSKDTFLTSRKIVNTSEAARLRSVAREVLRDYPTAGVTLLEHSEHKTKIEIKRDLNYLLHMWRVIKEQAQTKESIHFIYEDGNIVSSSIRDMYTSAVREIVIAGQKEYERARKFISIMFPRYLHKLVKFDGYDIFKRYGIDKKIESIYDSRVGLKSGGYLIINKTEALTAIDVNSGKALGGNNVAETAFNTNMEAAHEIYRQIRLRGIGGIIVIDFIDMFSADQKNTVVRVFTDAAKTDKSSMRIGEISEFGLLTIARQRTRRNVDDKIKEKCVYCNGKGSVSSTLQRVNKLFIKLWRINSGCDVLVSGDARFITHIVNERRKELAELEERRNLEIKFRVEDFETYRDFNFNYEKRGASEAAATANIDNLRYMSEEDEANSADADSGKKTAGGKNRRKDTRQNGRRYDLGEARLNRKGRKKSAKGKQGKQPKSIMQRLITKIFH